MTRRINSALKNFEKFHGYPSTGKSRANFHVPKKLVELGRAVAVIYESDKLNGGGDGKMAEYIHEFETPCFLLMDETARGQLYILGNSLKITKNGIEN